jgi:hypothetical protein
MARHLFLAFSRAREGREDDYTSWYDQQHLPDVLSVPGFISGQRFDIVQPKPGDAAGAYSCLVVYEIESDDLEATVAALRSRIGAGVIDTGTLFDPAALAFFAATAAAPEQFTKA